MCVAYRRGHLRGHLTSFTVPRGKGPYKFLFFFEKFSQCDHNIVFHACHQKSRKLALLLPTCHKLITFSSIHKILYFHLLNIWTSQYYRWDQWRYHNSISGYTYESSLRSALTVLRLFRLIINSKATWQNRTNVLSKENINFYGDLLLAIEVLDFLQSRAFNKVAHE